MCGECAGQVLDRWSGSGGKRVGSEEVNVLGGLRGLVSRLYGSMVKREKGKGRYLVWTIWRFQKRR